jgi:hypothetical protein
VPHALLLLLERQKSNVQILLMTRPILTI